MSHTPASRPPRRARRLNADYRWTVPKVIAFLDALARSGRVTDAARAVGMSRQSAYKLRARLDDPKFRAAFEGARKIGIRARAAASIRRSPWDGPGLAALGPMLAEHWRDPATQGGTAPPQADTSRAQGDGVRARADALHPQADGFRPRRQNKALDRVTPGPCLAAIEGAPRAGAGGAGVDPACADRRPAISVL